MHAMSKNVSPFDNDELWYFDELEGEHRKKAGDAGCEPGKIYWGYPDCDHEVPICPNCSAPAWIHSGYGCEHVIFVHDINSGYSYLHPGFVQAFWGKIFPETQESIKNDYDLNEMNRMKKNGLIPIPFIIQDILNQISIEFTGSSFGHVGVEYGFCTDDILKDYGIEPDVEYDYNV